MAKSYKKKRIIEEVTIESDEISKKEQYDLEKQKKVALKEKSQKRKEKSIKRKINNKVKGTNIASKIFAIFMLILMIGSLIVSALTYVLR